MQTDSRCSFDGQLPSISQLPGFLRAINYANPMDAANTPFQRAFHTELPLIEWAGQHPEGFRNLSLWLAAQCQGPMWLDAFPIDELRDKDGDANTPLFVDVGGGVGDQCVELRQRLPGLKRAVVVQDLPSVLAYSPELSGICKIPHDFWREQTVRGAACYYLKHVLHDYPDDRCVRLL